MMNPTRHEDTSPSYVNDYLSEERPKRYSSIDLKSFTSDFSERIGYGGFAEVYKGRFPCGELIAVKVLNKSGFVEDTFEAEVRTMGKTAHRNLVKFYGYCFEDNMKALVYEYMENGSLDKILYDNHHGNIELVKLYAIVIDIANVLQYLHHSSPEQIIHHDIKAANVLLDKNFSAKIADFGLARIMNRDVSRVDLSRTRGTPGYIAPEAWRPQSQVTFKCDVYSFGMMLFEVVGKRENGRAEKWFPGLVWSQFENGNLEHFLKDCGIIAEKDKENANILCKIALWCIQENPDLRPSMKDVVLMLEKEKLVKDPPFPPFGFRPFSQMIDMGESGRENIERERSDKIEFDPTYPQIITAGSTNESVAGSDGGVALPQLKSNRRVLRSPIMLERSDKMELDPTYPQNIFAGPSHASVADCSTELDQNLNQLKEKMVQLNALKMDVNNKVNIEEARIMKRTNQVDEWMKKVEATKLEVDRIILEGEMDVFIYEDYVRSRRLEMKKRAQQQHMKKTF
ncbi:Pr5-like receptor kinase [Thalictrum thalictroides]|uniref:non-specific serine/threonine protein kinase n=1 Tax=Thalictrum thalictroides TaxID=46969 RepID=A0A7J6VMW5_THATH|nr:Pr5-like receptor kinase [Thalictrum thalictroides]